MRGFCPDPNDELERRKKLSQTKLEGRNPNWKGDQPVDMSSIHEWAKRRLAKPDLCMGCQRKVPLDLANISQLYKRDLSDWEWLCRRCHMDKDGRMRQRGPTGKFARA